MSSLRRWRNGRARGDVHFLKMLSDPLRAGGHDRFLRLRRAVEIVRFVHFATSFRDAPQDLVVWNAWSWGVGHWNEWEGRTDRGLCGIALSSEVPPSRNCEGWDTGSRPRRALHGDAYFPKRTDGNIFARPSRARPAKGRQARLMLLVSIAAARKSIRIPTAIHPDDLPGPLLEALPWRARGNITGHHTDAKSSGQSAKKLENVARAVRAFL